MKVLLVTGGAGFVGSYFIKYFIRRNKDFIIVNLDKLTYTANINSLRELEYSPRYHFIKGDICNSELVDYVMRKYKPNYIINFAGESDTNRSINNPSMFAATNIMGTLTLLEGARYLWSRNDFKGSRFIQVSSDEVYGNNEGDSSYFLEEANLMPSSPYAASKAAAELMVGSYTKSYGLPAIITRSCSNYGPYQNSEKFVPKCIVNALTDRPISVYGDGKGVREWLHVQDHCIAIIRALFYGKPGEIYNIGTGQEISEIELGKKILKMLGKPEDAIRTMGMKPGYNKRLTLNSYKAKNNLSWSSKISLDEGLKETIRWYKANESFWKMDG